MTTQNVKTQNVRKANVKKEAFLLSWNFFQDSKLGILKRGATKKYFLTIAFENNISLILFT